MPDVEWMRYHQELADGGPQYAETNLSHFIVEPWNAVSSLFFLIPAIYWAIKIRGKVKEYGFIAYCIPLLTLGGLGSTFFHAFRSSPFLLMMDVLPILILTLSVSTYFWHEVFKNWWLTIFTVVLAFVLRRLVVDIPYFSKHTAINISYAIGGVAIFLPILIVLFKNNFQRLNTVALSIILFVLALFFREIDARNLHIFPMGTHFLWHLSSAVGAFFLADYLYYFKRLKLEEVKA